MSTTTKEGIEVKVGQVWRDLDKRMNKVAMVVRVLPEGKAELKSGWDGSGQKSTVSIRRMHRHSTGWKLERDA